MTDDIGSYRPCILPSPKLFRRMVEERAKAEEEALRRLEAELEDALFDEAIDRRIKELAA